jgi:hypothetical protein
MAGALVSSYDRAPYRDRVQAFLDQDQEHEQEQEATHSR